ncbi:MAG: hotdog fold thioesterase [Blastocatellia bacterium]|nr:hotdog fold thioesterase [Blastocatellia bacterium]
MNETAIEGEQLPVYRVRACNTSADSENKIHDDRVAAEYGFSGGLVPGVTVYAYMTVPVVARFGEDWLERGAMQVKFHRPFYEGEQVIVRAEVDRQKPALTPGLLNADSNPVKVAIRAEREDGIVCATGLATVNDQSPRLGEPKVEDYPEAPLPETESLPEASRENIKAGAVLGTLVEKLDLSLIEKSLLVQIEERLPVYHGPGAVAHPMVLLSLANYIMMRNFKLGPWIHAGSDLINWSAARDGEEISVRGRILDCFERKGHEFAALDLLLVANGDRIVQHVRHTAIYRPRRG